MTSIRITRKCVIARVYGVHQCVQSRVRSAQAAAPQHTATANAAAAHKRWSSSVFLASNSDSVMAPASSSFLSLMIPS